MSRSVGVWMKLGSILAMGLSCLPAASEDQDSAKEYEVKAAFLYNFAIHVEWPADAFKEKGSPIVIGVLGKDPFDGALERMIKGKTAQGRILTVVGAEGVEGLKQCHILFIPGSGKEEIAKVREALKDAPVLVVGESAGLLRRGAALNFFVEEKRVRIEANPAAAKRAGLKISAKLLKVARVVADSD